MFFPHMHVGVRPPRLGDHSSPFSGTVPEIGHVTS
jgi:hypothetical protein